MRIACWLLQDSVHQWQRWIAGFYYVRHCLQALATLPAAEVPSVIAFVSESFDQELLEPGYARQSPWLKTVRVPDSLLGDRHKRQQLKRFVDDHQCDIVFPIITPPVVSVEARMVGWIPDLQHRCHPQFFSSEDIHYRECLYRFLIGACQRVICSSRAAESDVNRCYPGSQSKTDVIRFTTRAPESSLSIEPQSVLARWDITEPYIYLPNQFWIHKNHQVVFEAWRLLKASGRNYLLVCSGAMEDPRSPDHCQQLRNFLATHRLQNVRLLGLVDRTHQWQLYRGAKAVVQPSLFEGWSTTVEEAQSLGKPLFVSDIPVHREQVRAAADFFVPADASQLAQLIDARWSRFPYGLDKTNEQSALARANERMQEFGRQLLRLFVDTSTHSEPVWGPYVLPLLLHMQDEAQARLEVIERLAAELSARDQHPEQAIPTTKSVKLAPADHIGYSWLHRARQALRRAA